MGSSPRVLIGTPIFEGMRYCLNRFLSGVKTLTYQNADILLVDNSKQNDFFKELKEKENKFIIIKDETTAQKPAERLVSSRNKILNYAVENNHDLVFMLDADVVCPCNIIEELIAGNKEIISGLYFSYFNSKQGLKILSVAWQGITPEEFEIIKKQAKFPESVKSHKDLQRHLTEKEINSNNLLEVLYPSAGCMLISKKVFEKIRYGLPITDKGLTAVGDDVYFITKAREAGFKAYCHTKFKCDHLLEGKYKKDKEGNLIHPLNEEYYKNN